jgi:hypothetical protein
MAIWYTLWPFGILYDHLVYFMVILHIARFFLTQFTKTGKIYQMAIKIPNVAVIWYIFSRFGILRQEKSGNPGFCVISEKLFVIRHHFRRCGGVKKKLERE